ncbi:MAG: hypothetical protein IJY38_02045, partial [Clostridia bacterium]|nr:hypothetical protein [Clostridia bacterium]
VVIKDLQFDWDWHFEPDYEFMRPGGAAIAEFAELPVKKITIKVSSASDAEYLSLGEIVVLGKDTACEGVGEWEDYSYVNAPVGSPHIEKDSRTFGDVAGTSLETWWGYDLTHDDGTADAYIEQTGSHDQYAYFKGVNSTSFYVEAEFTVTTSKPFAADLFPKFGIAMTTTQDYNNTIFFYVDSADNYTKKTVGCAQRKLDNTDWDWDSTEQLVDIPSINYTNGGYVKLGVLRIGNEFYMICNDQLAIYYDSFSIFNDTRAAACGFLSFNTGMKIKNYSATSDAAVIAEKEAQYAYSIKGENFGAAGGFRTTTGWDLTTDRGENPTVVQSQTGEQYAYFADVNSTKFTAELDITVTKDLGDPYPKFGMVLRNSTSRLFFYIDGAGNYTAQNVGYHLVVGENFRWQNADYNQEKATSVGSYTDGETVTLKIVRDGATVQLYVDGNLVFTLTDLEGFGASDACAVGAFSFTTGVKISNYSCAQN